LIVVNLYKRSRRFPVFASFRVPENKQQLRKSTLREQRRQKIEEEEEEEQQQTIDNDRQAMAVINEANCCLIDRTNLEVHILISF
jgi:hemolysin activation/secretion protein